MDCVFHVVKQNSILYETSISKKTGIEVTLQTKVEYYEHLASALFHDLIAFGEYGKYDYHHFLFYRAGKANSRRMLSATQRTDSQR